MKKRLFIVLTSIILVAVLAVSLSACIKLGLKKDAVIDKLNESGYSVKHGKTDLPFNTDDLVQLSIDSCFTAYIDDVKDEQTVTVNKLYVYYLSNVKSADTLEDMIKNTKVKVTVDEQEKEMSIVDNLEYQLNKKCSYYRNDQVILVGDFESVALIRSY